MTENSMSKDDSTMSGEPRHYWNWHCGHMTQDSDGAKVDKESIFRQVKDLLADKDVIDAEEDDQFRLEKKQPGTWWERNGKDVLEGCIPVLKLDDGDGSSVSITKLQQDLCPHCHLDRLSRRVKALRKYVQTLYEDGEFAHVMLRRIKVKRDLAVAIAETFGGIDDIEIKKLQQQDFSVPLDRIREITRVMAVDGLLSKPPTLSPLGWDSEPLQHLENLEKELTQWRERCHQSYIRENIDLVLCHVQLTYGVYQKAYRENLKAQEEIEEVDREYLGELEGALVWWLPMPEFPVGGQAEESESRVGESIDDAGAKNDADAKNEVASRDSISPINLRKYLPSP
ncbi:hypothetical protein F5Y16DRAFT_331639 [Xylariaceae sp. FL0255]|nr:hypothetical protein F5Y16DRAFT_331639 [Xylariaceae sp. FL0255]